MSFKTMPAPGPRRFPDRIAIVGDLGLTYNTTSTIDHLSRNEPDLILLVGDVTYANLYLTNDTGSDCYSSFPDSPIHETYHPRWDYWGRFMEPLISQVPIMVVEGNHEIEEQVEHKMFTAYQSRFAFPSEESGSRSPFYYSFDAGGIHFVMLSKAERQNVEHCLQCPPRNRFCYLLFVRNQRCFGLTLSQTDLSTALNSLVSIALSGEFDNPGRLLHHCYHCCEKCLSESECQGSLQDTSYPSANHTPSTESINKKWKISSNLSCATTLINRFSF